MSRQSTQNIISNGLLQRIVTFLGSKILWRLQAHQFDSWVIEENTVQFDIGRTGTINESHAPWSTDLKKGINAELAFLSWIVLRGPLAILYLQSLSIDRVIKEVVLGVLYIIRMNSVIAKLMFSPLYFSAEVGASAGRDFCTCRTRIHYCGKCPRLRWLVRQPQFWRISEEVGKK